ncbi:MAG: serine/threonine protein kinase [Myxococcales bacterium]|nr:serine/threonine protein kinase [Myxococcales bacterium]
MAEVWRAKTFGAGGFERLVAIKRILPNIAEDEEFISMFIDEAKITVQLSHANIAQIHELSHLSNSYFIAMEYVSGKDMRAVFDRCRKKGEPSPIPLTCYLIAKCCEGLDYAHRARDRQGRDMNIVHRDVSPQNALISYDGEVKVIDFGIAKAAGKATKTQAGILKGKFGYMSPEQIRGLPLDRRSDVFAIGVCLYEMLTGERLFVGDSDFSVLEKVRKVEVLPPSHFNRKIPEALERIVMKALAKDVDDRYQYASDLAMDLQGFMYSTGARFGERDLSQFMKSTFAEDYEKEKNRLFEYAEIKAPEGMALAAEMGFGVGAVPAGPQLAANASAVTALPTMVPPGAPPMVAPAGGLPPIFRPGGPPALRPAGAPAVPPPRPSNPSMPRLTAVAPMLTNEKEEHQATMLVDGGAPFDDSTGPGDKPVVKHLNVRNPPPMEPPTDPGRPAVPRPGMNTGRPGPPVLEADPPRKNTRNMPPVMMESSGTSPTLSAVSSLDDSSATIQPAPYGSRMAPVAVAGGESQGLGGNKNLILLAAVAAALILGLVAIVALKPAPKGLVMIVVPEDVVGKARLNINGEELTEADGSPLKTWPQMRQVPIGKASVMITAPGYEPFLETLEVTGDDPVQLSKSFKKK